jgi:formate dehydrogenase maturation protein FdhE
LVSPFEKIEKYDQTLNKMSKKERLEWTQKVLEQLKEKFDLNNTEFIILAGKNYYEFLIKKLPHYKIVPEEQLPIGKRVQWFQQQIKNS